MFPETLSGAPADVMVTAWSEETLAESVHLAAQLRSEGLRVDVYPEADKLGKQFKYAASRGIPVVAVLGEVERENGTVSIKEMGSGEQYSVSRESAADRIRELLNVQA
jgi:histidyl-tRNA synthetase